MRNRTFIFTILLIIAWAPPALPAAGTDAARSGEEHYSIILKLAETKDAPGVQKEAAAFFKEHPESPRVPDVRCILADIEASPDKAVSKYRVVVTKYRLYKKRSYAQYRICEIAYLRSMWDDLEREAFEGLRLGATPYTRQFSYFLIIARMHGGDYAGAEKECRRRFDADHDYNSMARSLLILSQIVRETTGFSREYIATIRDIALGYADSDVIQAALYFLGEFYENRKMYDEAYSAYSDLVLKYPGSPEAAEAAGRCAALKKYNPRRVIYLPGKKLVDNTEQLDIHPETDAAATEDAAVYYSISVGPLASVKKAKELAALLKGFDSIRTVKLKGGYALYVGRKPGEESVLKLKIRLAEEYGINGRIVRISGNGSRSYIYGE